MVQWADGAALKQEMDSQVAAFLGPRTAEDDKPLEKPKKEPKKVGGGHEAFLAAMVMQLRRLCTGSTTLADTYTAPHCTQPAPAQAKKEEAKAEDNKGLSALHGGVRLGCVWRLFTLFNS